MVAGGPRLARTSDATYQCCSVPGADGGPALVVSRRIGLEAPCVVRAFDPRRTRHALASVAGWEGIERWMGRLSVLNLELTTHSLGTHSESEVFVPECSDRDIWESRTGDRISYYYQEVFSHPSGESEHERHLVSQDGTLALRCNRTHACS